MVGKFGKLSSKLPLVKYNLVNCCMERAPCNKVLELCDLYMFYIRIVMISSSLIVSVK